MSPSYLTRAELFRAGMSRHAIRVAVRDGHLMHVRRDRYLSPGESEQAASAVRVGGRLTCLSLLAELGVFVLANDRLHVHIEPHGSRLRAGRMQGRPTPLTPADRGGLALHWRPLARPSVGAVRVHILDALAHAVRCQEPRAAIATLDSAVNRGLIDSDGIAEVFSLIPARFAAIRPLLDGRAQAGSESLVRLIARTLGCTVEVQVYFDAVGYVDLLLDGWLVVECDSREFHGSWEAQARDHRRDMELARRGYASVRLPAADVFSRPELIAAVLRGLLSLR